jgi:hypothetical protein
MVSKRQTSQRAEMTIASAMFEAYYSAEHEYLNLFLFVAGVGLVALAVVGLILRPQLARTGRSAWNWRIAPESSEPIHDSYYVMAVPTGAFAVLLLIGVTLCIYAFRIAA